MRAPVVLSLALLVISILAITPTVPKPTRAQSLTPHSPIYISGDAGFTPANGVVNGSGTPLDPYVIAGWDINNTGGPLPGSAIHVTNTRAAFIIRDILIHTPTSPTETSGVHLENSAMGVVERAQITGPTYGISVSTSPSSLIRNNNIWNTTYGIYVTSGSDGSVASKNVIANSTTYGMWISGVNSVSITDNNVTCNNLTCNGYIATVTNSVFDRNTARGRWPIANLTYGYRILSSTDSLFRNNTIINNPFGFVFNGDDFRNIATGNKAYGNQYGMGLEGSYTQINGNNTISENIITGNDYGIYIFASVKNRVFDNYLNNTYNAYAADAENSWNITKTLGTNVLGGPFMGGNFYSDYQGTDANGDGFGDTPYTGITGNLSNVDALPLVLTQPGVVHDIAATSLTVQPSAGVAGTTFTITVKVSNQGTTTESFTVNVYSNQTIVGTLIGSRTIANLPPLSQTTATVTWDTSTVPPATYNITAVVPPVAGETYTADNKTPLRTVNLLPNVHDIAVTGVAAQPTTGKVGTNITLTANLSNQGTNAESFTVNFYRNQTLIGSTTVSNVAPGSQTTTTILWRTMTLAPGDYSTSAQVPQLPGETNIANNNSPPTMVKLVADLAPVAVITQSPVSPTVRNSVTFDASGSNDPDGTIATYIWDFGDSTASQNGRVQLHAYQLAGSYTVTLTVTDDSGSIAIKTTTVTVSALQPTQPMNLQVSYTRTDDTSGTITLTWNPPSDNGGATISVYRIYRGIAPTSLVPYKNVTGTMTTYVDNPVSNGRTYYYTVTAINSAKESSPSSQQSLTVPSPPPQEPNQYTTILVLALAAVLVILTVLIIARWVRKPRR